MLRSVLECAFASRTELEVVDDVVDDMDMVSLLVRVRFPVLLVSLGRVVWADGGGGGGGGEDELGSSSPRENSLRRGDAGTVDMPRP